MYQGLSMHKRVRRALIFASMAGLSTVLAGCATQPPASNPAAVAEYQQTNDPLEPMNRFLYRVNLALDTYVLRPAAQAYVHVLPQGARNAIHNELTNLAAPVQLGNDILEAKSRNAGNTFMRMIINTTAGGLGFFDPATGWGYPNHDTDFGVTLAVWGAPEGPFLFLPLLGPPIRATPPAAGWTSPPTRSAISARARQSPRRTGGASPSTWWMHDPVCWAISRPSSGRHSIPTPPSAAFTASTGKPRSTKSAPPINIRCLPGSPRPPSPLPPPPNDQRDRMMISRRLVFVLAAALGGLSVLAQPARAQSSQQAVEFLRQTGDALVQIVNSGGSDAGKAQQLQSVIDQRVDVDGIARFVLGRFWRTATPEQQQQYLSLFRRVLEMSIDAKLGEYRGVSFAIGRTTPAEGGQMVSSVITRPGQSPANVDWLIQDVGGQPKIVDVVAEGTSSGSPSGPTMGRSSSTTTTASRPCWMRCAGRLAANTFHGRIRTG